MAEVDEGVVKDLLAMKDDKEGVGVLINIFLGNKMHAIRMLRWWKRN